MDKCSPNYHSNKNQGSIDEKYLATLVNYIDDKAFNERVLTLPKITSAIVKRLEKTIANENKPKVSNQALNKIGEKSLKSRDKSKGINLNNKQDYLKLRHLVFDIDNNHSDFSKVEEALEIKTKIVSNPIRVFLQENNDKMFQQALGMIVDNVFKDKHKKTFKSLITHTENTSNISTHLTDTQYNLTVQKTDNNKFSEEFSWMKKKCESLGLVTLEQKLDTYQLYHENNEFHKTDTILNSKSIPRISVIKPYAKKNKIEISCNTNVTNESKLLPSPTLKGPFDFNYDKLHNLSKTLPDYSGKYLNELKIKFKITDDTFLQNKTFEQFYQDILLKVKSSRESLKTFSAMTHLEKIRCIKNLRDLNSSKCIIKEIEVSPEKFIYLIYKKGLDFKNLIYINLSRTNLGDLGCSYALYLIELHSKLINYINLSSTKFGKASSDILSSILSKNSAKITSLNISGNQLGDKIFCEICLGISKNQSLERLWALDNNLGKTSAMIIGTLFKYDKKIKMIDFSKNYFSQFIYNIFKGLIMNSTLEILVLRECDIENNELKSLNATLHLNNNLKELYLDSNKFTNQACLLISNILNSNKSIEIISILGNKIDSEGVETIIELQKLTPIKVWNKTDFLKQKMDNNISSIIYEYF